MYEEIADSELLLLSREEPDAFGVLYERHTEGLLGYFARRTFDVEAIAIARRLGFGVQEVAIDWRHDRRSRIHLGRDGAAMVWAVPRMVRALRRVPTVDIDREASEVFDTMLVTGERWLIWSMPASTPSKAFKAWGTCPVAT